MRQRYRWLVLIGILLALLLNFSWGAIERYGPWLTPSLIASAQASLEPPLSFTGTEALEIERFVGSPTWGTSSTESTFLSGSWQFLEDGEFVFTPLANANVRRDIFPITGTYSITGNTITLQGDRQSDESFTTASLDGTLQVESQWAQLDAVYTVSASELSAVRLLQRLTTAKAPAEVIAPPPVEGIPAPAAFAIALRGSVDGQPFGPLPGELKILPPSDAEDNQYDQPVIVNLITDEQGQVGNLSWLSGVPVTGALQGKARYSTVIVEGNNVRVELYPSEAVRADVSWSTTDPSLIGELVQTPVGVLQVGQGVMNITLDGDRVAGRLELTGTTWLQQESTLQAEFSGQVSTTASTPAESTTALPSSEGNGLSDIELVQAGEQQRLFTGTWDIDGWGEVVLEQNGTQVEGTYSGPGMGRISGTVEGNRLDFTWRGSQGSGSGHLRAIAGGQNLVGLWMREAAPETRKAIAALRTSGSHIDPDEIAITDPSALRFTGQDLAQQGRCQDAILFLKKALEAYEDDSSAPETSDLTRDGNLVSQVRLLDELSFCHIRLADYDALIDDLTAGVAIRQQLTTVSYLRPGAEEGLAQITDRFDTWRVRLTSDIERIDALDGSQRFFQRLTKALVDLNDTDGALVAAEKGRARAIADIVSASLLAANTDRPTIAPSPTLEEIKQTARLQQATLVEYAMGSSDTVEETLFIWVVSPSGEIEFEEKPLTRSELRQMIRRSRRALGTRSRGGLVPRDDSRPEVQQAYLQDLYQALISPIQGWLAEAEGDRVIVIPQNDLFLVPFPALLDEGGQPLIAKHTLSTSSSIQLLTLTSQRRLQLEASSITGEDILLVGNPDMSGLAVVDAFNLKPLPGTAEEVDAIAELYGAQPLKDGDATETAVLQRLPTARVIHLATHGLLDTDAGADAQQIPGVLVLAQDDQHDGLLTASDLLRLNLKAELAVLSACDTGLGNITSDGVIGLSRSLFEAQVPSVMVSLWAVPDAPTAGLMIEFYRRWQGGMDKARALREAMLGVRSESPDPVNWAAFTLIGDAS